MSANVYYDPDKFGLTTVGEVEFSSSSYEFDTTVVWRDAAGRLLWADDAGCSCPTPFEGVGVNDLATGTPTDLQAYLEKRKADSYEYEHSASRIDAEIVELMGRVV